MKKINIGCGEKKIDGFINVDLYGCPDVRCDLSVFPWPFDDDSADEILAEHFLEHVVDFEKTILEVHRVLKPGGVFHFKVPHFRSSYFPWHLHNHSFSTMTCKILCYQLPYQFGGRKLFDFCKVRANFIYVPRIVRKVLDFCANIWLWGWDYFGLPLVEIECWVKKHPEG